MQKLLTGTLLLFILMFLQTKAFALSLDCKFRDNAFEGVDTIQISANSLIINQEEEIPLEKSRVNCGHFGRQMRLDGDALGYQVILKSCSSEAKLEGHIIDAVNNVAADVYCQPMGKI
jgi:hypothetical protein